MLLSVLVALGLGWIASAHDLLGGEPLSEEETIETWRRMRDAVLEAPKGYVASGLDIQLTPGAGWGIVWRHGLNQPEEWYTVFKIPYDFLICNETSLDRDSHALVKSIYLTAMSPPNQFFRDYFRLLPKDAETLLDWEDDELISLENDFLLDSVRQEQRNRFDRYSNLVSNPQFSNMSFAQYRLITTWLQTRAFGVNGDTCLVPLVDHANHAHFPQGGNGAAWEWDDQGTCFVIRSNMRLPNPHVPVEFTFEYQAEMTNEKCMRDYGFAYADNSLQTDNWVVMPESRQADKRSIRLQYFPDFARLATFFRFHSSLERAPHNVLHSRHVNDYRLPFKTQQNELRAFELCYVRLEMDHPTQTTKVMEANVAVLSHSKVQLSHKQHRELISLRYRLSYLRLFERHKTFCRTMQQYIRCHTWRAYRTRASVSQLFQQWANTALLWKGEQQVCI